MRAEDTFAAGQRHAEFPEKELVSGQFIDMICGSLTKENLCHAFVN
jgi:hypothetical protein